MYLQPDIDKRHQGTYQYDRLPDALSAEYVKIDERTLEDLLGESAEFSRFLTYFDSYDRVSGDWKEFFYPIYHFTGEGEKRGHVTFSSMEELETIIADKPYLSLLVTFLKLFKIEQDQLNTISEKHLLFYYETVLRFARRKGSYGDAAVAVQLNKGTDRAFIPKGTLFEAGKDAEGNSILYCTAGDVTASSAKIVKAAALFRPVRENEYRDHLLSEDISTERTYAVIVAAPGIKKDSSVEFALDPGWLTSVQYTASDGWKDVSGLSGSSGTEKLLISLKGATPSKFDSKVHGGELGPGSPAFRFNVNPDLDVKLNPLKFSSFKLDEGCSAADDGMKTLSDSYSEVINSLRESVTSMLNHSITRMRSGASSSLISELDALSQFSSKIGSSYKGLGMSSASESQDGVSVSDVELYVQTPMGMIPMPKQSSLSFRNLAMPADDGCRIVLGVSGLNEGDLLNLYCRLDQSKCNISKTIPSGNVGISWWDGSGWERLSPSSVLKDSTSGMTKSGFISIRFPAGAFDVTPGLLPDSVLWFSISFDKDFDAYPGLSALRADMIGLELSVDSPGKAIAGVPLPAGSIKKPVVSIPGVKKVSQDFDGFPGEPDESEDSFRSRVSERLRHKNRMSTMWDYEHLILQHHPNLLAVRCIPATRNGIHFPGAITIVVLPDCRSIRQDDPLKPSIGADEKDSITRLVKEHSSPFVHVDVANPLYRPLKVECNLIFKKGCADISHCKALVAQRLEKYLAPWTSDDGRMEFPTSLNTSVIEYYIERMDDIVEAVKELRISSEGTEYKGDIVPDRADVIFTSVPAEEHVIQECKD